jgi:hypothetical protein
MEKQARIRHAQQRQQWAGCGPWRRGTKLVVAGSGGSLFELCVVGVGGWWWGSVRGVLTTRVFCANGDVAKSRRPLWRRQKSATNGCEAGASGKKTKANNPLLDAAVAGLVGRLGGGSWWWWGSDVCSRLEFFALMVLWRKVVGRQKSATNGCKDGPAHAKSKANPL